MPETDGGAAAVAAFFEAIRGRDLERVAHAAASDPTLVRAYDPGHCCGGTVMNVAVGLGDIELLDLLLDLGADPDQPSDWPPGPFRALHSIPNRHLDRVGPWLIERGATVDAHAASKLGLMDELRALLDEEPGAVNEKGPDGQRPLHVARTPAIAAALLERGADLEARCVDHGSTPAEYAATSRPDVCRFLLDRGARGDEFMYAMIGDLDRLRGALDGDPAVLHARTTPDRFRPTEEEAAHIYMYTIGSNATLLHAAVAGSSAEIVRFLAERGLDPDARGGYDDQTPAHGAAWADDPAMIRALVEVGADIDLPSGRIHRNPPLGWAIVNGSADAVPALLEAGAEVRDGYLEDARKGREGAFREWSSAGPERFDAILAALRAARSERDAP